VVVGRVVGLVVGLVVVRTVVVGSEHVGLLAPLVQQYFPFPPLVQPYELKNIFFTKYLQYPFLWLPFSI
jgi:hypothetical protein